MYRFFNKYNRGKPKIYKYGSNAIKITRAGLSSNPVQRYSFTGGDIFKIDDLVTTNGKIVETAKSKTYDFANTPSNIIRVLGASTATLQAPTGSWSDYINRTPSERVKLETIDGITPVSNTSVNGNIAQFLVELDLTELATQFGGNAKLKEALTGITVDAWAKGSGANASVLTNGVNVKFWVNSTSWSGGVNSGNTINNTGSITDIKGILDNNFNASERINSSNKLYILVHSAYASDGTIPSSVSLDYISIKIDYKERSVTNEGAFFVGGDTATYEFDMGLKVAGSVVECPMRIWYSAGEVSPTLASFTSEVTDQPGIDKLKSQESTALPFATSSNGKYAQLMLELNLTPLCNSMFGGSNSALKAALKSIAADVWAMASGANASALTYGCNSYIWKDTSWQNNYNFSGSSIGKMSMSTTSSLAISSSNKAYILIASQYASDGTIPSSVSLDYLNIKIDLARTPDTVQPIQVNLGKYWAMVVKGFSPSWDSNSTIVKHLFNSYADINNRLAFSFRGDKTFQVYIISNGTTSVLGTGIFTFLKNQVINVLITQTETSIILYTLLNNGTVVKTVQTLNKKLVGLQQLFPLQMYNNTIQADTFAESFHLIDLQRIGKSAGLSDAEAEIILRGIPVPSEAEMVVNGDFSNGGTGWTGSAGTYTDGKGIVTISSGNTWTGITSGNIYIIPNSTYTITIGENTGTVAIMQYDINNTKLADMMVKTNIVGTFTGVTLPNCAYLKVHLSNGTIGNGTFTFDNISLKYVKPQGAIAIPNTELFDINKVTLHANATRSNGVITLNASANYQESTIKIPVLPNNRYEFKVNYTGGGNGGVWIKPYYNNIYITTVAGGVTSSYTFTTGNNVNYIVLGFNNNTTIGTFTFSNISLKLKM